MRLTRVTLIALLCYLVVLCGYSQVEVDVNLDIKHSVNGVSDFGRDRHITLHASMVEPDWEGELDKARYLLNDLDVYMGRDNGSATWKFQYGTAEDPDRTNYADMDSLEAFLQWYKGEFENVITNNGMKEFQNRTNDMICGTNPHPTYPTFSYWYMCGTEWGKANGYDWIPLDIEASAEWVVQYLDKGFNRNSHSETGELMPKYWEVINEPDMKMNTGQFMITSWELIWEYHNLVAQGVKQRLGNNAPMIGGMTWGLHDLAAPDLNRYRNVGYSDSFYGNTPADEEIKALARAATESQYLNASGEWSQWDVLWKGFMNTAGSNMDFYAVHIYDWPTYSATGGKKRTGAPTEGILDMIESYDVLTNGFNNRKPIVLSEYGSVQGAWDYTAHDKRYDWEVLKPFSAMLFQFLERPDYIIKSMPFTPIKATWGDTDSNGDGVPEYRYQYTMMRDDDMDGNWEWSDYIKWYELWSEVDGTRVDTKSSDPDIQVDCYIDGRFVYVLLNNLETNSQVVDLNLFGTSANPQNVNIKHLYLSGTSNVVLANNTQNSAPSSVTINPEATMILKYTYGSNISINHTSTERKFFGASMGSDQRKTIAAGDNTYYVNGVTVPSGNAEAMLRITANLYDDDDDKLGHLGLDKVTVNGTNIAVTNDWRGTRQGSSRYFGTLEIPIPASVVRANNTVVVDFHHQGEVCVVNIVTWAFSKAPGRTSSSSSSSSSGGSSSGGSSSGGSSSGGSSSGGSSSGGSSSGGTLQLTNVGESITLDVGQTFQLQYNSNDFPNVHFNTNSGYANVNWNTGLITGAVLSNGNFATITVYDDGGSGQTDAVKVYVAAGGSSSSGGSSSGGSSSGGSSSGGSSSGGTTNLALNKAATQSSNYNSTLLASKAVDGNTSGTGTDFNHTKSEANAWWQVDLGSVSTISNIQVYNRTSCCQNRLTNFYVLVSDVPFTSTNLNTARNQSGVSDYHTAGTAGSPTTINVNRSGRYVRVQLAGTNFLHMAEVKVNGTAGSSSSSSGGSSSGGSSSGSTFALGNPSSSDASHDGWKSNMVINETDTYTNDSGSAQTIQINTFNFYAWRDADPVTPFVVRVNGDNNFTVLAVGTTRSNSTYNVGNNSVAFNNGTAKTITLNNGEKLATGFLDANANGTGGSTGSVIPFDGTSPDQIWYTGGSASGDAGQVAEGSAPTSGSRVLTNLSRNYHYNIEFAVVGGSSSGGSSSGGSSSGCTGSSVTVEAESFTNTGGTYNDGNVPLGANKSANSINWVNNGDWMDYTVNVPASGTYSVAYQISSPITGSTIQITAGSSSNTTTVPNNSQWDSYTNLNASGTINLNAGSQTIRLAAGAQTWTWNLDKFTLTCAAKEAQQSISAELTALRVYPNPVNDELNVIIDGDVQTGAQLMIYHSTGSLVKTLTVDNNELKLHTGEFTNGMYILKVINGTEVISKSFFKN